MLVSSPVCSCDRGGVVCTVGLWWWVRFVVRAALHVLDSPHSSCCSRLRSHSDQTCELLVSVGSTPSSIPLRSLRCPPVLAFGAPQRRSLAFCVTIRKQLQPGLNLGMSNDISMVVNGNTLTTCETSWARGWHTAPKRGTVPQCCKIRLAAS